MINKQFKRSIDNLSMFCNACGKDRGFTDFESLMKKDQESLIDHFNGSRDHWCQNCIDRAVILIDEFGKTKNNDTLYELFNLGRPKYCSICGKEVEPGRQFYCKDCKKHRKWNPEKRKKRADRGSVKLGRPRKGVENEN